MITTKEITFQSSSGPARAFVAMPEAAATAGSSRAGEDGKFNGVMLIHEWWGLNAHTEDLAKRFAAEGYVTLAPDLYGGKVTADPAEAGQLMKELRSENALSIMTGALQALDEEFSVSRIGVVGFCMGGSMTLLVGCHSNRMSALVPFYGEAPPEEELARIHSPILFIGAEDDPWITSEKIEAMRKTLEKRHKTFEIVIPKGTKHAFFNDTRSDVYNADAAKEAWGKVLAFLDEEVNKKRHAPAGTNPTWLPDPTA
jgi:carboxymethylenebutenolidase